MRRVKRNKGEEDMEFREFTAKTSTEAITKACLEFGTSSDNLEYEIVREGTSGFFGFGFVQFVCFLDDK